jgi:hypothetical protein
MKQASVYMPKSSRSFKNELFKNYGNSWNPARGRRARYAVIFL